MAGGAEAARAGGGHQARAQQHHARGPRQGDHTQGPGSGARRRQEGAYDQNPGIPRAATQHVETVTSDSIVNHLKEIIASKSLYVQFRSQTELCV